MAQLICINNVKTKFYIKGSPQKENIQQLRIRYQIT
jgi:hypothetical protein